MSGQERERPILVGTTKKNASRSRVRWAFTSRSCIFQSEPKTVVQPWLLTSGSGAQQWRREAIVPSSPRSLCLSLGWFMPREGEKEKKRKKQKQKQTPLFLDKGDLRFQFLTYCKFENTCFSIVHNKIIIWLVMEFSFGKKHPCILKKRVVFQFAE